MKSTLTKANKHHSSANTGNTSKDPGFFRIQAKLQVNQPGDRYEQEADHTAEKVIGKQSKDYGMTPINFSGTGIQRKTEEETIQEKPLANTITPLIQQKGEEEVQAKEEENQESELTENGMQPDALTEQINASKGKGNPMDSALLDEMNQAFGTNFSDVRIHTDADAAAMNMQLGSQAFANGKDIYFNTGKYNPDSEEGKYLLAHELTHTIQQAGTAKENATEQPVNVQRNIFSRIWSGIKKTGKAIWSGVKYVGKYSWNVLKSAGAWVWDLVTEAPTRIWRIMQHVGSGIIGTLTWMWDGIKGALGHIWSAATGIFSWMKEGVEGLFSWVWKGIQGGARWALKLLQGDFSEFWTGISGFFSWIGDGVKGLAKWGWDGLKGAIMWSNLGVKGFAKWIGTGIMKGLPWVGRFVSKLLDLGGFGEIMDLVFNIVKFNTRTLTSTELQEAKKVFGNSISYWQVRIDEASLIAKIGAYFNGGPGMGVTLFHTINFDRKVNTSPGSPDMEWLIHELTHVSQYEHVGSQYIGEAIHAQNTAGYDYGNEAGLIGKNFKDFNREQQGDIIADYYYRLSTNAPYSADYERMVSQARKGKF